MTVFVPQTELHLVRSIASRHAGIHVSRTVEVIGVNQALERADVRLDFVVLVAEHALPVLRVHHRAGLEVPVVDAFLRALECQREPFLAFTQGQFSSLPLGQIEMRTTGPSGSRRTGKPRDRTST